MRRTLLVTLMGGWLLAGCATARSASARPGVPTKVVVHVASSDAKLIGAQVGGARVTLRDAATGEVLAEGLHTGGSGDTKKIMVEPHRRGEALYDTEGAARFTATLMLAEPTVVEVSAEGPLEPPAATRRASTTVLKLIRSRGRVG